MTERASGAEQEGGDREDSETARRRLPRLSSLRNTLRSYLRDTSGFRRRSPGIRTCPVVGPQGEFLGSGGCGGIIGPVPPPLWISFRFSVVGLNITRTMGRVKERRLPVFLTGKELLRIIPDRVANALPFEVE